MPKVVTLAERPELVDGLDKLTRDVWPNYIIESDNEPNRLWPRVYIDFAQFQLILLDDDETIMACGNSIPFTLTDVQPNHLPAGWDDVFLQGMRTFASGGAPNALALLAVSIGKQHQSKGLSLELVKALKVVASTHAFTFCVVPVRPNWKMRYPLTPMDNYVRWTRADGAPFDPWLRVHWRLGAKVLAVAQKSMVVTGSIAEWETWTGLAFPETGCYIVPGALAPVSIDLEKNLGTYIEPNVWMQHPLSAPDCVLPV